MSQSSNLVSLPGSQRPTVPPADAVPTAAPAADTTPIQLDQWGRVAHSIVSGGITALAQSGGPKGPGWLAGVLVAVGLVMVVGLGILGVQVHDLGTKVDQIQGFGPRIETIERRLDATQAALVSSRDSARAENRWSARLLLDLYRASFPGREPPPAPDTEVSDRQVLNLR